MEGAYGKGKYCPTKDQLPRSRRHHEDHGDLARCERASRRLGGLARHRRPDEEGLRALRRALEQGRAELGFADTGAMWRSKYDMPPEAFAAELDRLWEQVRPLYVSLHAYVRWKLREKYGDVVPANGPIPAHLLGNMWAQDWDNVYPLVAPKDADPGYDLTEILKARKTDAAADGPVRRALLHLARLRAAPEDVLGALDVREAARPRGRLPRERLGHRLRRRPAHQDVHRHHGRGLHDDPPRARPQLLPARLRPAAGPLPRQRQRRLPRGDRRHDRALGHARVPRQARPARQGAGRVEGHRPAAARRRSRRSRSCRSASLIDQWRWKVFSGEITPAQYNQAWWELRRKYQGVAPAVAARRGRLRPGREVPRPGERAVHALLPRRHPAVPVSPRAVPRRGLQRAAQPLLDLRQQGSGQRSSTTMLAMGCSKPWPDALEAITGQRQMDATAILDYFAPLQKWLDEQNRGKPVGW